MSHTPPVPDANRSPYPRAEPPHAAPSLPPVHAAPDAGGTVIGRLTVLGTAAVVGIGAAAVYWWTRKPAAASAKHGKHARKPRTAHKKG